MAKTRRPNFLKHGDIPTHLLDNIGGPHVTGGAPGTCKVEITALELLTRDPYTYGPSEVRIFTINVT